MRVFKFGGASVKDADGIKNVYDVLQKAGYEDVLLVVSAMGKTTNSLELVIKNYFDKSAELISKFYKIGDPLKETTNLGPMALPDAPLLLKDQVESMKVQVESLKDQVELLKIRVEDKQVLEVTSYHQRRNPKNQVQEETHPQNTTPMMKNLWKKSSYHQYKVKRSTHLKIQGFRKAR
jgi:hypothetical protein